MRHTIIAIIGLALLCCPAVGMAKKKEKATPIDERTSIGFGAGFATHPLVLDEDDILPSLATTLVAPIQLKSFRMEPSFKLLNTTRSFDDEDYSSKSSVLLLEADLGLFYTSSLEDNVGLHVGLRAGINMISSESSDGRDGEETEERTQTQLNYTVQPTLGAEIFLSDWLSIGGELGLGVIILGDEVNESSANGETQEDDEELSGTTIYTNAMFILRGYLN